MADQKLIDAVIGHQIDLLRLAADVRRQVLEILNRMQRDLVSKLASADLTDFGKQRTAQLLKECSAVIDEYYLKAQGELDFTLQGVGQATAAHTAQTLTASVAMDAHLPTETFFKTLVSNALIQGAPSAEWWSRQSLDTSFKFANAVRQGLAQGETNQQIIARVIGKAGYPGVMEVARNNAAALVQTSVQTVANEARLATFRQNSDIVSGLQQISTLDGHTTEICIAYSGAEWDLDGKPINGTKLPFNGGPPRHWNCRSLLVPVTKTFKELGIDMPEPARTTRASTDGQVSASTTFEQWLSRRSEAQQDAQLGKGRAQLYRDKTITLSQLLDMRGNAMNLSQLRDKYGVK